jgi:hypothetical protein
LGNIDIEKITLLIKHEEHKTPNPWMITMSTNIETARQFFETGETQLNPVEFSYS